MKKIIVLAIFSIFIIAISASYLSTLNNSSQVSIEVHIVITKNFGKELIQEDAISVSYGTSALEALESVAKVETKYGGKFVVSIKNIKSEYPEKKYDWFFYVNGFLAKEGGGSYILTAGDSIQWDYHNWEYQYHQSAIIGDYPMHFVKGYDGKISPTIIIFEDKFLDEATKLKRQLNEQYGIRATTLSTETISDDEKSKYNIIILARPNNQLVLELNEIHDKIGFHAFFDENIIIERDYESKSCRQYSKAGMIQVTQNIWNPSGNLACENVILLISGTDTESIRKSVDILIQDFYECRYSFGLIITEEEIFKLPNC